MVLNKTGEYFSQIKDGKKKTAIYESKKSQKSNKNECNNELTESLLLDVNECKENNDGNNNNSNDCCFVELPWILTPHNIKHFPKYRIEIINFDTYKYPRFPNANVMLLFYHKTLYEMFDSRRLNEGWYLTYIFFF